MITHSLSHSGDSPRFDGGEKKMFQVSIRCLLLVSAAQSCWHRGNIKYGRRICLHCPRTPSSRGETTFTLAELPPSTETSRFLWGSFRMIDAVSIFNPSLSLKETSSSPLLNFLLLPPVEENAPLCATTRMPDPGGVLSMNTGCETWMKRSKYLLSNDVNALFENVRANGQRGGGPLAVQRRRRTCFF